MRRPVARSKTFRLTGVLSQGMRIRVSNEEVRIPADKIETGEIVFRVAGDLPLLGLADRDLLIVERRTGHAATGELVIATLQERAFIGRWWAKYGARSLLDNEFQEILAAPELTVLGAVTLIARHNTPA